MRRGVFCGEFDYKSLARVEYQYTSLRHLPYSCLLRVQIIPKENIEVSEANIMTVHESLRNPKEYYNRIFNGNLKSGLVRRLSSMTPFLVRKSVIEVHGESGYIRKSLRSVYRQVNPTLFRL